jgi:TPR repeat protein
MTGNKPDWRDFPAGVSVLQLVDRGDEARARGDAVAAGNWYFHAKRRGAAGMEARIAALLPELESAAAEGDPDAMTLVAAVLLEHRSDPARAASLFGAAAEAGNREAMRELGFMLSNGVGVTKDLQQANSLLLRAAEAGDGYAAFNLSVNHYHGNGVPRSFREFSRWLEKAAGLGIPEACAVLGDQMARKNEDSEALRWYVKAAESGHVPAMLTAARRYRDGLGVGVDPVQALRWFLAPLDRGNGDGLHEAIQLAHGMSPESVREAGRLSGRESEAESLLPSS